METNRCNAAIGETQFRRGTNMEAYRAAGEFVIKAPDLSLREKPRHESLIISAAPFDSSNDKAQSHRHGVLPKSVTIPVA
jgi:hypothetical protein